MTDLDKVKNAKNIAKELSYSLQNVLSSDNILIQEICIDFLELSRKIEIKLNRISTYLENEENK